MTFQSFLVLSVVFWIVAIGGVGFLLHRRGVDKTALDALKQDVADLVAKFKQ